jgi:hypothetical protein
VQISLPEELAKAASQAGLLAPEAMQELLREKLRSEGMASLKKAWAKAGDGEPSEADEAMIAEAIRQVRATRKAARVPPARPRPLRIVIDTNIAISALLWGGQPRKLLELVADPTLLQLFSSSTLLGGAAAGVGLSQIPA